MSDVPQFEIKLEDLSDCSCFLLVDGEGPAIGLVAERYEAAHPHALALGGGDLVADALSRDLALELGEGQQHVERQSPHGISSVELLSDGYK